MVTKYVHIVFSPPTFYLFRYVCITSVTLLQVISRSITQSCTNVRGVNLSEDDPKVQEEDSVNGEGVKLDPRLNKKAPKNSMPMKRYRYGLCHDVPTKKRG